MGFSKTDFSTFSELISKIDSTSKYPWTICFTWITACVLMTHLNWITTIFLKLAKGGRGLKGPKSCPRVFLLPPFHRRYANCDPRKYLRKYRREVWNCFSKIYLYMLFSKDWNFSAKEAVQLLRYISPCNLGVLTHRLRSRYFELTGFKPHLQR